jgi:hypothetical protein
MHEEGGRQRKLIIFTEYKDTLRYLATRIRGLLGSEEAVVTIDGGDRREERRKKQEMFRSDPAVRILVATDAAGEGVNLQNAHMMVNYDLPWNPNRLEQRFGRIHRIGQTEVCRLWNLVAAETREGDVFQRLLQKLEIERQALGGRVFDILGDVFDERSLRDLLIEAIRYGDDPEVRAKLLQRVEGALDTDHLREIMRQNALCDEVMDEGRLFAIKAEMEKAEARKLQPYFIRAFFSRAFEEFGGELRAREPGRWEITHVPASIRERDRQISGRDRRYMQPVMKRYERVCFEKEYVRLLDRVGAPMAALIHPGHPLMQAVTDLVLEAHRPKLRRGAVLVDPNDAGTTPGCSSSSITRCGTGTTRTARSHGGCSLWRSMPKGGLRTGAGRPTSTSSRSARRSRGWSLIFCHRRGSPPILNGWPSPMRPSGSCRRILKR